jgi:hypothetical protein
MLGELSSTTATAVVRSRNRPPAGQQRPRQRERQESHDRHPDEHQHHVAESATPRGPFNAPAEKSQRAERFLGRALPRQQVNHERYRHRHGAGQKQRRQKVDHSERDHGGQRRRIRLFR